MRILHVGDRLGGRGGAHWHLRAVVEQLLALGHHVELVVGAVEPGVEPPCRTHLVAGLEARERRPAPLDGIAGAARPDVIHLHTVVNPAVLDWAAGRPAVLTVQDHRYFCPGRGKWTAGGHVCAEPMARGTCAACFDDATYFEDVYALTAERLAAAGRLPLVVLSHYMKAELAAAGVPAARIAVVPPFVHGLDAEAAPSGPPCVLFAGRLAAGKGVRDAMAAWRASSVELPLVFAGTGPLRAEIEGAGFEVLGWVPHARLAAVFRRARALLLPSRWQEPFGIVGLEALAMGTPVAAWRSGGVSEWHPGGATLSEWGDVPGLARALRAAVEGPRATAAPGFEADALMRRLTAVYAGATGLPLEDRQHQP
jgi:glycosyltransferase involved in cell wall biosynthesis